MLFTIWFLYDEACEKVIGHKEVIEYTNRRSSNLARFVASSQKIYGEFDWKARNTHWKKSSSLLESGKVQMLGNHVSLPAELFSAGGCFFIHHYRTKPSGSEKIL
ncbi:hypothetical protein AZI98_13055 [Aeribacillus pallidus]|mgnify:CR=1 FL=1|uniref:Uncharacterized protein n=1 Tax=Aeribacillus pallidus TaxID=33936 RepID=A0A161Y1V8_9BACI|nr:hypothetical protein AZI98_13055 [Aeribacillus pallidus]